MKEEDIAREPAELCKMLKLIRGGLDQQRLSTVYDGRARDRECCVANVRQQLRQLVKDESVMAKIASDDLIVVGAFYEMSSGCVFL